MGIRELTTTDLGELTRLAEKSVNRRRGGAMPDWRALIEDPGRCGWAGVVDGAIVGTVFLQPDSVHSGHAVLGGLWVAEPQRGQGIAHGLVSHALAHADAEAYQCVKLWVAESNEAACQLYQDLRFRPTGRLRTSLHDPFGHLCQYVLYLRPADGLRA